MNFRAFLRPTNSHETQGEQVTFLVLLLLSFLPYVNTLTGNFVYDDDFQVIGNPYVHSFKYVREIFGSTVWSFQGAQGITNYYRPLMSFAYLLIYKIAGPIPFTFHFVNLILHALTVWMIYCILRRLSGERVALVAAGLFALHPIHTESVAWIAAITDLELSVFYLLTFLLYLRLSGNSPGIAARIVMCASFVLALLSKEQAITLPALITIFEHFYRDDRTTTTARQKFARYGPLWGVAAAYLMLRTILLGGVASVVSRPDLSWYATVLSGISLIGAYLGKLVWPAHLSAYHVFHPSSSLGDPRVVAGLAGLAICGMLFLFLWGRVRILSFGLVWMFLTLGLVLNARWMPASVFAERYLYLPSVGFCWIVAWAAVVAWSGEAPILPRALARAVPAALMLIGIVCGVQTVKRNKVWLNEDTLYRRTLDVESDASLIRTDLGAILFNRGDSSGAEHEWLEALSTGPNNVFVLGNLGLLRSKQDRYDEALDYFGRALRLRPMYISAHLDLADTLAEMDRAPEAEWHYRTATAIAPLSVTAHNRFGEFLFDAGRVDEARAEYERSVAVDPSSDAYDHLGDIFAKWNDSKRAEDAYTHAVALDSIDSHAHFGLGKLYEAEGRPGEAIRELERGLETNPSDAEASAAMVRLRGHAPPLPSAIPR
jgi:tetratricopeptide (TPR) repeat protein